MEPAKANTAIGLVHQTNETMTRVGPGTPMGEALRRFWTPALLSSEVGRDKEPVRLRILGEDLIAFRDSIGTVGIVDAYCPHKLAPLFFGRNENCGLRCVYHGWKFNTKGECVDIPNIIPPDNYDTLVKRMRLKAYPVKEAGGLVWVYMGPQEKMPELPHMEWMDVPADQVHVSRWLQRSNWVQGMEGELDSSHLSFLHSSIAQEGDAPGIAGSLAADGAPIMFVKETAAGFFYAARRRYEGQNYWRVTHWMLPSWSATGPAPGDFFGNGRTWVPVDDFMTMTFAYQYRLDRPLNERELDTIRNGSIFPPLTERGSVELPHGHVIDTFLPKARKENDYFIDRERQRTVSFSGVHGINTEDRCLQEGMPSFDGGRPGIVDRTREHLVASDAPVIAARRVITKMANDLVKGIEPNAPGNPDAYMVRAAAVITPISDFEEFLAEYGHYLVAEGTPPAFQKNH